MSRRHAFSVLEVLIAALILGVTTMTVYPLFVSSRQIQTAGRYRILAASFARETMETLRARRLSELPEGAGVDPIRPADHPFVRRQNGLRQYEVRDVFGAGFARAKDVGRDAGPALEQPVGEGFRRRGKLIVVTVTWDAPELGSGVRSEERLVLFRSGALPAVLFP